ncbi:hypothetical protein ROTAS13_03266 [Roseomonas sp. TAS13]|uniref:hypothetical protein n=1 Tax=Roseomonas TaxID=125216 RepID=UPI0009640BCC|nr:hypothetical protein [Roseomonas sp. TAS13]GAV35589.1 hypothetical protein ROTAS13_03266 [Roseomonas sp. TAS13]
MDAQSVRATAPSGAKPDGAAWPYAEVWGDTVVLKDLGKSVVIGAVIALACYFAARWILSGFVATPQVAKTYAMLFGLIGCIIAGAVCARLFAPKRDLSEQAHDDAWREATLEKLAMEAGGLGRIADLPASVQTEMRELDLYDSFVRYEAKLTTQAEGARV